jgi:hypothetical protein
MHEWSSDSLVRITLSLPLNFNSSPSPATPATVTPPTSN